ncbi:MAG: VCBS repeat-containing protein [Planctomycetes bacterium]|nr:VCBS repeat-containing protein [Planctomycetota bacterium]
MILTIAIALWTAPAPWVLHPIDPCGAERGADGTDIADVNRDGRPDIVCGWEQAAQVRLYLSRPGDRERPAWDAVQVTPGRAAGGVEDAAFADLDGDGRIDVLAACESQKLIVAWAPAAKGDLARADAWTSAPIPSAPPMAWMNVEAVEIDGRCGIDIVAAGKQKGAGLYWFESPEDPRDLAAWRAHAIDPSISWAMSVIPADLDGDGDPDIVLTDRPQVIAWYEHPGFDHLSERPWKKHVIQDGGGPYLWGLLHDIDGDGEKDILAATFAPERGADPQKTAITWWRAPADPKDAGAWTRREIRVRSRDIGSFRHKALAVADFDGDGRQEIVLSTEQPGDVYLLRWKKSVFDEVWSVENIIGRGRGKYDDVDLLDLDGDGDLDILTSEEYELGVFWLENPRRR